MNLKKYAPYAVSLSLLGAGLAAPGIANAEVSASLGLANMYLWRGVNLAQDGGTISGSLDYANESGVYAGIWTTSEQGGHETDVYLGYAGEAGDISYDVSYILYMYPEDTNADGSDLSDNTFSEVALGVGFGGFGVGVYVSTDPYQDADSDWVYYTLDYSTGKYNILYGAWTYDDAGNDEYSHVTLTYSYNDNLSFAVSVAQDDIPNNVETDPLFVVTYSVPLGE